MMQVVKCIRLLQPSCPSSSGLNKESNASIEEIKTKGTAAMITHEVLAVAAATAVIVEEVAITTAEVVTRNNEVVIVAETTAATITATAPATSTAPSTEQPLTTPQNAASFAKTTSKKSTNKLTRVVDHMQASGDPNASKHELNSANTVLQAPVMRSICLSGSTRHKLQRNRRCES